MSRVGVEYYNSLLKDALNKKLNKQVETKAPAFYFWGKSLIPIHYISNSTDRFSFYTKIHRARKEKDLEDINSELRDRYGKIPKETESFVRLAKLSILYKGSLVESVSIGETSLVFKIPNTFNSGGDLLIPKILSYKSKNITKKSFKESAGSVSVVFSTKVGYNWFSELLNCISLFYKT